MTIEMKAVDTGRFFEQAQSVTLANGLKVITVRKPGFRKKAGLLAVNYGSDDVLTGAGHETPAGVAHFLEHKMFDMPDGRNVLQIYGELGASPNAFTSHTRTAYHFEATERFEECLKLLLEYVYTPYYTVEGVDKEQGIIGQELSMYRDMPQMRLFDELMALTYKKLPVRLPIGGTHESIAQITADTLYDCHKRFYTPSNMVLCVAGDIEPQAVAEAAARLSPDTRTAAPDMESLLGKDAHEPETVTGSGRLTVHMDVPLPLFGIAVKMKSLEGMDSLTWETHVKLASECLAGMSAPLYSRLYEDDLIDGSFGFDSFMFRGGGCLLFIGQSRDPEAVCSALIDEAARLNTSGVPSELFERVKRSCWGAKVRTLDSMQGLCRQMATHYLSGCDFFMLPDIFANVNPGTAATVLSQITREKTALLIIEKHKEGKA